MDSEQGWLVPSASGDMQVSMISAPASTALSRVIWAMPAVPCVWTCRGRLVAFLISDTNS